MNLNSILAEISHSPLCESLSCTGDTAYVKVYGCNFVYQLQGVEVLESFLDDLHEMERRNLIPVDTAFGDIDKYDEDRLKRYITVIESAIKTGIIPNEFEERVKARLEHAKERLGSMMLISDDIQPQTFISEMEGWHMKQDARIACDIIDQRIRSGLRI